MPTTAAEVTAARERTNTAIATAAADALTVSANTIAAVIQSNNSLAIGRLNIQAAEALRHLMDESAQATTAEDALAIQRENQQQIQALTDLINRLQAAHSETTAEPIVAAPPTTTTTTTATPASPAVTPAAEKSHALLYVGLGIAGLTLAGGIAYFAMRAKPVARTHRNPWDSSSDALGGADSQ